MAKKRNLAEVILKQARFWGLRIVTAESCTAGMLAAALTKLPGSSEVLDCGFVTYSNASKTRLLGVPEALIAKFGAVSEPVAQAMAMGALERSEAGLSIAITGIAGPGGSEFKPEGRVCFALAQTGRDCLVQTVEFGSIGRDEVRRAARGHAMALLADRLSAPT
jgi:nicotinamide-nucleotide amidase